MNHFARLVALSMSVIHGDAEDITVSKQDLSFLLCHALAVPKWVKWVSTDKDGRVFAHESRPDALLGMGRWVSNDRVEQLFEGVTESEGFEEPRWNETLVAWDGLKHSITQEDA